MDISSATKRVLAQLGEHLPSLRTLLGLVLAVAVLTSATITVTARRVVSEAEKTARSQPYCIQVADGKSDYRSARSWLDLSAFGMWASRSSGMYMQHHSILVVGEAANQRLHHWSYRHQTFEAGVVNDRIEGSSTTVTCVPVLAFAGEQLALFPNPVDSDYVKFSEQDAYRIPKAWQARWSGGSSPSLFLATSAPSFQPLGKSWDELMSGQRDSNWIYVGWDPAWVLNLIERERRDEPVERNTQFGLSRSKSVTVGKDGREYVGYRYVSEGAPSSSGNTTIIGCGTPTAVFPRSCQHRFINRGRTFYFRHRPEEVADWQEVQKRVLDLITSFEVHDRE